jgi:Na+-translocating ferredoxin:NAD+ oxidoreductase RnfE subunit
MSAGQILTGATSASTLSRDVFLEVKEAFDQNNIFLPLIMTQVIESGHAGQFVIGGKDTDALALTQGRSGTDTATGTDISVNAVQMDERIINLDNVIYDARRIDEAEEKVAQYEVRAPITKMIGTVLSTKVDKTIVATMGLAAEETGLASNPDAPAVIVNAAITGGADAQAKGNALGESIMEAVAALETVDNMGEKMVAVSPLNAAYLSQSDYVNKDYTSGDNGGRDTGLIGMVGGAKVYKTNHLAAATNIENLQAFVFTSECVGYVILQDIKTEVNYDFNKFATLISGRYKTGCDVLRPECIVAIASGAQS